MELIGELIAGIFRGVLAVAVWAVVGCFQAMAGILHPTTDPKIIKLQRWALAWLALSLATLIVGLLLINFVEPATIGYAAIAGSSVLMIIAGHVGKLAEHEAQQNRRDAN